jgi:hypothetical protein
MSRHIKLVLLGSLPAVLGCGGCGGSTSTSTPPQTQEMEEVEEIDEQPPPDGTGHLMGAPFVGWWMMSHPPLISYRLVPRAQLIGGGYTRSSSGYYSRTYYGRSSWIHAGSSRPASSSSVVHGGFGSTGHAASAGA